MEISIIFKGGAKCNMNCSYCSGHLIEKDNIKIDYDAIKTTFDKDTDVCNETDFSINIWGGEPLIKIDYIKELMAFLEEYFDSKNKKIRSYFISTNGIPLANKDVIDFIYETNSRVPLNLQISHDGLGQKYRSQGFDPFYSDSTKDVIVKLAKDGIFNLINCTITGKNCSMNGNMFYFNKWFNDNNVKGVEVKLNHINDSDYSSEFNISGESLNTYIHEYEQLLMDTYVFNITNNVPEKYKPFSGYFYNQITRDNLYIEGHHSGCENFSTGLKENNWSINTIGEYVQCQLWDTPIGVQNPNSESPEYCKKCEYFKYSECHACPNNTFPEKCEYRKAFIRMILRLKKFREIIDSLYNKDCNCDCNGSCQCRE